MAFTLILVSVLLLGLVLLVIGGLLLIVRKDRLPGFILLAIGLLVTLSSIAGFLSLVITSRTMG